LDHVGTFFGWALVGAAALVSAGCGSSDDDEKSGELIGGTTPGCGAWQTALCDWIEGCGGVVGGCREQVAMTVCQSDSEAEACSAAFTDAGCAAPPEGCDLASVVDTAPAVAACESFVAAWCAYAEKCEPGSKELCVAESVSSLGCSNALGVGASFDSCVEQIAALECSSEVALPEPCRGVLLLPD
jgi:hypothetical protein